MRTSVNTLKIPGAVNRPAMPLSIPIDINMLEWSKYWPFFSNIRRAHNSVKRGTSKTQHVVGHWISHPRGVESNACGVLVSQPLQLRPTRLFHHPSQNSSTSLYIQWDLDIELQCTLFLTLSTEKSICRCKFNAHAVCILWLKVNSYPITYNAK